VLLFAAPAAAWSLVDGYTALAAILSGALLGSLALAGHSAASKGTEYAVQVGGDFVHLIGAGAWLGAIPWLVHALRQSRRGAASLAQVSARRFSGLGIASVSAIVASGLVNAWYLVGGMPGLFGTLYGRLLLVKLGLLGGMLSLAYLNRARWTPRLDPRHSPAAAVDASRRLARNAVIEIALGAAVIAVAGWLGATPPGAHTSPSWPFPFTLAWPAWNDLPRRDVLVAATGGSIAFVAIITAFAWPRRAGFAFAIALLTATAALAWISAVPASPTTYVTSPEPYAVTSITRGAAVYMDRCARCHGRDGYGDGEDAAHLAVKPPDLTQHALHHREGDLYWWVSRGIAGSPMPAFESVLAERDRWDVVNYVVAIAEAEAGNKLGAHVSDAGDVVAPDFTFQIGDQAQESLASLRGRYQLLLVLFDPRRAASRLCELAQARMRFESAGLRVLAVPMSSLPASEMRDMASPTCLNAVLARGSDDDIAFAYALFRRSWSALDVPPPPDHLELLIDRNGALRARWLTARDAPLVYADADALLREVDVLSREPLRAIARHHAH